MRQRQQYLSRAAREPEPRGSLTEQTRMGCGLWTVAQQSLREPSKPLSLRPRIDTVRGTWELFKEHSPHSRPVDPSRGVDKIPTQLLCTLQPEEPCCSNQTTARHCFLQEVFLVLLSPPRTLSPGSHLCPHWPSCCRSACPFLRGEC